MINDLHMKFNLNGIIWKGNLQFKKLYIYLSSLSTLIKSYASEKYKLNDCLNCLTENFFIIFYNLVQGYKLKKGKHLISFSKDIFI